MKIAFFALTLAVVTAQAQAPPPTPPPAPPAGAIVKNLEDYAHVCVGHSRSTICMESFAAAINDAKKALEHNPNAIYLIQLPAGTFDFSGEFTGDAKATGSGRQASIDVSGISPRGSGRLVIQGEGRDKTILVTPNGLLGIYGERVSHLTFSYMTFTRPGINMTQGLVVDASRPGQLTLDIQDGFPSMADVFNTERDSGRFLRVYTNSRTDPQLALTMTNWQIPWGGKQAQLPSEPVAGHPRRWIIFFDKSAQLAGPDYTPGALVCVKSKKPANAYIFDDRSDGGSDIVFDNIRWTQESRGAFHGGITGIKVLNSEILRSPAINGQTPCLSTNAGGPQIGQPGDQPTHGNLVENFTADATGDDSIAFFNDNGVPGTPTGSIIRHVDLRNSFGSEIKLHAACGVTVEDAKVVGCSPLRDCPITWVDCPGHPGDGK